MFAFEGPSTRDLRVSQDQELFDKFYSGVQVLESEIESKIMDESFKLFELYQYFKVALPQIIRSYKIKHPEIKICFETPSFGEADEAIVSTARKCTASGNKVIILSSDSDFFFIRDFPISNIPFWFMDFHTNDNIPKFVVYQGFRSLKKAFQKESDS